MYIYEVRSKHSWCDIENVTANCFDGKKSLFFIQAALNSARVHMWKWMDTDVTNKAYLHTRVTVALKIVLIMVNG